MNGKAERIMRCHQSSNVDRCCQKGCNGMSLLLILLLLLNIDSSEAFLSSFCPSKRQNAPLTTGILKSTAAPLRQEGGTITSSSSSSSSSSSRPSPSIKFHTLNEFNKHLAKIASKCGSFNEPVISRATECQELWEMEQDNDDGIEPDLSSFRTTLTAWNKCTQTLAKSRRDNIKLPTATDTDAVVDVYTPLDAAKRATALLLAHPEPDLLSYNLVMDAWSKSRTTEAPEAAERLLKRMMDDETVDPDTATYNLLIDAWANSGRENSLDKVMQIYRHMEALHKQGNNNVAPTIRTVNAVIHAHAKKAAQFTSLNNETGFDKAEECADAAYQILQDAKARNAKNEEIEWRPDIATYTSCMDVLSRVGRYRTTKLAEGLLEETKDLYVKTKNSHYKPNFRTYTAVVTAWSRTRSDQSPQRVEALMEEMSKDNASKPNARTYTAAIQCWARARNPLKAKRALKLLMEMREEFKKTSSEDMRPSTLTYNHAIDCCARCQGTTEQQTEAIKIAFAILKTIEMDKTVEPTSMTYSTLLRAISFLIPEGLERNKVSSVVFEKAKKKGLVDFNVVRNLRRCVDVETMRSALDGRLDQKGRFDVDNLPLAWSRNV